MNQESPPGAGFLGWGTGPKPVPSKTAVSEEVDHALAIDVAVAAQQGADVVVAGSEPAEGEAGLAGGAAGTSAAAAGAAGVAGESPAIVVLAIGKHGGFGVLTV